MQAIPWTMGEEPVAFKYSHESDSETGAAILSFLSSFYAATNCDKLSNAVNIQRFVVMNRT
jgi:hypothetical protein